MSAYYKVAAKNLLEKNLSELLYEEALSSQQQHDRQRIELQSGHVYTFVGQYSIWGHWIIEAGSVRRDNCQAQCPLQLLVDAQNELELNDSVLANLMEEMGNSLVSDVELLQNRASLSASAITKLNFNDQQMYFEGHPKAIANKGRMGWGMMEHQKYAPEHSPNIQLRWLATQSEFLQVGYQEEWTPITLLQESLSPENIKTIYEKLPDRDGEWHFIPVHPWQWEHKIQTLFARELADGVLVDLGQMGDFFQPQQSLRTLANRVASGRLDIKLPITVLNTSCFRGIPARYIRIGAELSAWLKELCAKDIELTNTHILQEVAGVHLPQSLYQQVAGAPYRYHELLGAIWREPVQNYLGTSQQAVMLGALWQTDNEGQPLLATWLTESGLNLNEWLSDLFKYMVVPLYHLLCRHGVGLVAHGQNITLVLEAGRVVGLALKDFQGDLRLDERVYDSHHKLSKDAIDALDRLPAEYLIHDLQTGNFVTALRFLSALCLREFGFCESMFYGLLAAEVRAYQTRNSHAVDQHERYDLFTPKVAKLCINRVRLVQGYDDSAQRPIPIRGSDVDNPLFLAEKSASLNAVQENVA